MLDPSILDSRLLTYMCAGYCDFWTINPYPKCDHNCIYCITQVQGDSVPVFDNERVLRLLSQALGQIPAHLPLVIGGISDAYPGSEGRLKLTRSILQLLNSRDRAYSIITKGIAVERDIDVIADNPRAQVVFSFSTLDEELSRNYELNAPSPLSRMRLLQKMSAMGIATQVSLKPWLPGITDVQAILDAAPEGVPIKIERLKIIRASRHFIIEGELFSQQKIDELYLREQKKYAGCKRLEWQMDQSYCRESSSEEHPVIRTLRENGIQQRRLLDRGKLLDISQVEVINTGC